MSASGQKRSKTKKIQTKPKQTKTNGMLSGFSAILWHQTTIFFLLKGTKLLLIKNFEITNRFENV